MYEICFQHGAGLAPLCGRGELGVERERSMVVWLPDERVRPLEYGRERQVTNAEKGGALVQEQHREPKLARGHERGRGSGDEGGGATQKRQVAPSTSLDSAEVMQAGPST